MSELSLRTAVTCALLTGCLPNLIVLRGSSAKFLTPEHSEAHLPRPVAEVAPALQKLFLQRGFPLADKIASPSPSVTVYVFKGRREMYTSVSGSVGEYGGEVSSQSYLLGSWFAARVTDSGSATEVALFGKPSVNGVEVCSREDARLKEVKYWCQDTHVREDAPERALMTGREESETIRGILVALTEQLHGDD